jgi:hypothetical protein
MKQQELRRSAVEAALHAEEACNVGAIGVRLNEEHKEEVKQLHKTLLEKVLSFIQLCLLQIIL